MWDPGYLSAGFLANVLLANLPTLLVLLVGLVLVAVRRPDRRVAALAMAGCGTLLASAVLGMAWTIWLPGLYAQGSSHTDIALISTVGGLALALARGAGLALLIAAVVVRSRRPADGPVDRPADRPVNSPEPAF